MNDLYTHQLETENKQLRIALQECRKALEEQQQRIDKALKELEWVLPVYTTPIGQVIHLEDKLASIEMAIKILEAKNEE